MGFDERMAARVEQPLKTAVGSFDASSTLRLLRAWLEREAFPVVIAALYGGVLLLVLPGELVQDSWSTLVSGREIVGHGLPQHETLTVMAHGVRWVDQQWLAQLTFYGLFRAGGYRLVLLVHALLVFSAFALALVAARRRGGSPLAVFGVGALCFFVAPWAWQLRAQSFAPLLFVAVLFLLVEDSRRPSHRVLAVLPLLALWGNLHGSVVLGALLVAIYGVVLVVERRGRRPLVGAALVVLAPLAVLCSPYAFSLVGYYRQLLIDPPFAGLVNEWSAPTPRPITALFYLLAFVTVWALGRRGSTLTIFERLALLVTLASALHATRNIIWFGLTALVLLPLLLDRNGRSGLRANPAARAGLALALVVLVLVMAASAAAKPSSWYTHLWPDRALAAVSVATRDPGTRVFASDRDADWLLWRLPQLRGRMAYDVRFELNTAPQVKRLQHYFARIGPDWQSAALGYDVIVLDRTEHERVRRSLLRDSRLRQIYVDHDIAVLVRRLS
jgi:hypothetical protein